MKKAFFLFLLLGISVSCDVFTNENNLVTHYWFDGHLIVENGLNDPVYYAVFDQEILAVIDWAPASTEENKIDGKASAMIAKDEIVGFQEGETVVLFYWTEENSPMNIKSAEIEPK